MGDYFDYFFLFQEVGKFSIIYLKIIDLIAMVCFRADHTHTTVFQGFRAISLTVLISGVLFYDL